MRTRGALLGLLLCFLFVGTGLVWSDISVSDAGPNRLEADKQEEYVMAQVREKDFLVSLYADQETYTTNEAIQLWAEMTYVGEQEQIEIWHAADYFYWTIKDEAKGFYLEGVMPLPLVSTTLIQGEPDRREYIKTGGWGEDDPDAEFWEAFFSEEELYLPSGTYTVQVTARFSVAEDPQDFADHLLEIPVELQIQVL